MNNEPTSDRTATSAGNAVSVFSGASIGLMTGVLLALAVSPVVGIFIGALGTALAALLGLNDAHFSTAKGLRIGSLGLALLVGVAGGIYVRTHDLLSPSLQEERDQYLALGYSKAAALRLLEGRIVGNVSGLSPVTGSGGASEPAAGSPSVPASAQAAKRTSVFGSETKLSDCELLFVAPDKRESETAANLIANFRSFAGGWTQLANDLPSDASERDKKAVLFVAMNAACGEHYPTPATPVRPTQAQCAADDFSGSDALPSVSAQLEETISPQLRAPARKLLGRFLCSLPS